MDQKYETSPVEGGASRDLHPLLAAWAQFRIVAYHMQPETVAQLIMLASGGGVV